MFKLMVKKKITTYRKLFLLNRPYVLADLPSGQVVRFLVGFKNNGEQDFLVESMDASFRYPQDYSFIIQNVS